VRILRARPDDEPIAIAAPEDGPGPLRPRTSDGKSKWV